MWKSFFFSFINQRKTWPLFHSLSYVMHTIDKKDIVPLITLVTQLRSRERRKLHFRESNFTNFPGGIPPDPLGDGASSTQCSRQRRERCTSASWTTASSTCKYYRKPCVEPLLTAGQKIHISWLLFKTSLQRSLSSVPKMAVVERFNCIQME